MLYTVPFDDMMISELLEKKKGEEQTGCLSDPAFKKHPTGVVIHLDINEVSLHAVFILISQKYKRNHILQKRMMFKGII